MKKIKILFLAASPTDRSRLRLDEEFRSISKNINGAEFRDSLELISAWAVRPDDLLQLLQMHKPDIVHFSGHGGQTGEILLVDNNGEVKPVSTRAMKALFTTLKDNIQIVFLNACYSRTQAESIREVINFVVGMNTVVSDSAALVFAASFYRALGFGRTVREAFDQGITALLLEGISEEDTPEFLIREGADPGEWPPEDTSATPKSPKVILKNAEALLLNDDPEGAYKLLETVRENESVSGEANQLSALTLMSGRSFNRMSPEERGNLERHLNIARKKMGGALLPLVCLALLEIDYYNFHGQASLNNIQINEVAQKVRTEKLSENDARWLGTFVVSRNAKRQLGLDF